MKTEEETKQEEIDSDDDDDDTDELFGWMATTYESGNINDFSCTLQNGIVTSVSDGETTVSLT